MPLLKKPTVKDAIVKMSMKKQKDDKSEEEKKPGKGGKQGETGKPQDNQALTEAALAQLENKDPNYVSEYIQNLGDKEQMRLWKKFEADRKAGGDQEAYVAATQGVGSKKKARTLLISWLQGGCSSKSTPYMEHMSKYSTSHAKGLKTKWQPLHYMLQVKYGARELKARVLAGTISVRKNPADERFPEFLDVADYETQEAKKEMAKMVQNSAKCSWSDFKVLNDLENKNQELRFELPKDEKDPKKKNDEDTEDHLQPLIGGKKKAHDFDDWGFGRAAASGSAASQALTCDSKALRALENCESLVAGKSVPKDKLQLALVRAKGACGEVHSLLEEKLLETDGKEAKQVQGKIKDLNEVLKLFKAKKMDQKQQVALVRRSAKVAKACSEVLSLEDNC